MRKHSRVPGLHVEKDVQPRCSKHRDVKCERNENGEWYCPTCFNDYAREIIHARSGRRTASGIELPYGTVDPAKEEIDIKKVMPNRAQRRAQRRRRG